MQDNVDRELAGFCGKLDLEQNFSAKPVIVICADAKLTYQRQKAMIRNDCRQQEADQTKKHDSKQ
jgi:hypothetical protein